MLKNLFLTLIALLIGLLTGFLLVTYLPGSTSINKESTPSSSKPVKNSKDVLGFLPYWFLSAAKTDYSGSLTVLDYFSLTVDVDGTILKSTNPVELEPGYYALTSGKVDPFLENAKARNIKLSLTVFSGDQDSINKLIADPIVHADNLVNDVLPIMNQYGFTDLNLDIEGVGFASPSAQINYQTFVSEVRSQTKARNKDITLSMDIIPVDFIRNDHLTVPSKLFGYLDQIIVMAYDFHSPSSFVTGPVAPLYGAGSVAEFDTQVAIDAALKNFDSSKILLGLPFYGYSWETIDNFERAAIVPSSALIESNKDVEDLQSKCATCSAQFDPIAQEKYIIYKNTDSGTYQQIFYPDSDSVQSKIDFVKGNNLGGVAIWALGYEAETNSIWHPIQSFLLNH